VISYLFTKVGANSTKMGLRADTRKELRMEVDTKIHGQLVDHDVTQLEKELIAIAATIPTTL
jgi:hypothetical protein